MSRNDASALIGALAKHKHFLWFVWTLALSALFVGMAATDLANYPTISGDETWIISISQRLVTQGIFGSDIDAGLFNADRHVFHHLPVHQFVLAVVFQLAGVGVTQARWASLVSAVVIIWVVSHLASRWYGSAVALITSGLLVFWRSNLSLSSFEIPLLSVARSARYDISGLTWMWLSIALLDSVLRHPRRVMAFALGVCAGLTTLTQFFGASILPIIFIAWFQQFGKRSFTKSPSYWIVAGALVIILPYSLFVVTNFADVVGQLSIFHPRRSQLGALSFYLDNIQREPFRYGHILQPSAPMLAAETPPILSSLARMIILFAPLLIYLWWRAKRNNHLGSWLLLLSLIVNAGFLAILEQTKAPIYALALLPSICMALAVIWVDMLRWVSAQPERGLRFAAYGASLILIAALLKEGLDLYESDQRRSKEVSVYVALGERFKSHITPGAVVSILPRWWLLMDEYPRSSLQALWLRWQLDYTRNAKANGSAPQFAQLARLDQVQFMVLDSNARQFVGGYPSELQDQFWGFVNDCSVRIAEWVDPSYGPIEVRRVLPPAGETACSQ